MSDEPNKFPFRGKEVTIVVDDATAKLAKAEARVERMTNALEQLMMWGHLNQQNFVRDVAEAALNDEESV